MSQIVFVNISRKLARWRISINGFNMNSSKVDMLMYVRCCICEIQIIHFLIEECILMTYASFMTIVNARLNDLIMKKGTNTFKNWNCTNIRLWELIAGEPLVLCIWQLSRIELGHQCRSLLPTNTLSVKPNATGTR